MKKLQARDGFFNSPAKIKQTYQGKAYIQNTVTDIYSQCNHYAKYVLKATEGTLEKGSNNPVEQNHSSTVHWVGAKLYEEPGY